MARSENLGLVVNGEVGRQGPRNKNDGEVRDYCYLGPEEKAITASSV